ncbi:MAG TPA: alpha/beta hydrolase [Solirubrobacterales bacterium]
MSIGTPQRAAGVFYEEHGSGDDVIVWLHGFGSSTENWDRIVTEFPDHHSFVFDLPGHGESADVLADGTIRGFAGPIVAALDELGLERFTMIGYSTGGAVSMRIAIDHPTWVTRLIGVVPWYSGGGDADDATLSAFAEVYGEEDAVKAACDGMAVADPPRYGRLLEDMLKVSEAVWKGFYTTGSRLSQADELPGLEVPVTYLLGLEDNVVLAERSLQDVKAIPGGRAVVLAEAGHLCAYEIPDVIVRELRNCLEAGTPGAEGAAR